MAHKCKVILDRELKTDLSGEIYKQGKIYVFHACSPEKRIQIAVLLLSQPLAQIKNLTLGIS